MNVDIKALKECFEKVKPAATVGLMGRQPQVKLSILRANEMKTHLRLEAYSGELFIRSWMAIPDPGLEITECVPTIQLEKILAALPGSGELQMEFPGRQPHMEVKHAPASWRVPFLGKDSMPDFPNCAEWPAFAFSAELADGVAYALHSACDDTKKQNLCGVRLDNDKPEKPCLVTTDTHRLSLFEVVEPIHADNGRECPSVTLPLHLCKYVMRYPELSFFRLERNGDDAPKAILFSGEHLEVYSSLVPGDYPEWRRIVPEEGGRPAVTIETAQLLAALPAVDAIEVSAKLNPGIRITISAAGNEMEIYARTTASSAQTSVGCEPDPGWSAGGYALTAWANRRYIKEMAQAMPTGPVLCVYRDKVTPLIFQAKNRTDIIMPMKGDDE